MSEELAKELAEVKKALADATAELEKAKSDMADMKAEEDKKKKMEDMKKNDETVEVAGQVVQKSVVGDAHFAIMKAQAAEMAELKKAAADAAATAEFAKLEKRASEEYGHVPGTNEAVAKMLKAMSGMEEDVAKSFEAVLKSVEERNAGLSKTIGFSKSAVDVKKASERLSEAVDSVMKRDSVTKARAMEIVAKEQPELVNEAR